MNCLFIETASEKILIETGIGEKWTEKQIQMYGIFRAKAFRRNAFRENRLSAERYFNRRQHASAFRPRGRKYDYRRKNGKASFRNFQTPDISFPNPNLITPKIRTNATAQAICRKIGDRF
jgi:hypothetical protein